MSLIELLLISCIPVFLLLPCRALQLGLSLSLGLDGYVKLRPEDVMESGKQVKKIPWDSNAVVKSNSNLKTITLTLHDYTDLNTQFSYLIIMKIIFMMIWKFIYVLTSMFCLTLVTDIISVTTPPGSITSILDMFGKTMLPYFTITTEQTPSWL